MSMGILCWSDENVLELEVVTVQHMNVLNATKLSTLKRLISLQAYLVDIAGSIPDS